MQLAGTLEVTPEGREFIQKIACTVMNIYAEHGDKVIFAFPNNGYQSDADQCAKYLKLDETYTVDHTMAHRSSTDVFLIEVPGQRFNSVMFADFPKENHG